MADNLVIVESPAKAKTIEGFLGKDFIVKSSFGHVRDLVKNDKAIDVNNNFTPLYEVSEEKSKVVDELRRLAKKAKMVWLATDEDREGEAISWHLYEALELKKSNTKRIVFHEITKKAILDAVANPRFIDMHMVDAQQARRILDRLVGFELSPILWKKVKPSLSAGRVQSVSVKLIVEREREVEAFDSKSAFRVIALFNVKDKNGNSSTLKAELPQRFAKKGDAEEFLKKLSNAKHKIDNLEVKPGKKSPSAPFTTSTLQQEASRKLGFSVSQTMVIAQRLYESGKITYMRTDSVNLSQTAIDGAKEAVLTMYGKQYSNPRQYKNKNASAQEAHEAIRPTDFHNTSIEGENGEKRLYDLIWKRSIASQMSEAVLEKTVVTIGNDKSKEVFNATGEVVRFDGFLRVYMEGTDDENEDTEKVETGLLPPLKVGQVLDLDVMTATEKFSLPPARYTEASLVKKLEELGIGRPSTYAPTISTIQKRGYVIKEDRMGKERKFEVFTLKNGKVTNEVKTETYGNEKSKMFPSDIGTVVTDFLSQHFPVIMDYNFTATVEKDFDEISDGNLVWTKMIKKFYGPFHKSVEDTEQNSERATGERELGTDPKTGRKVIARIGRFGPLVQINAETEDDKPQYARLRTGQRLETITIEEALDLFKMPRNLGQYENIDITIGIGRFGPYAKMDGLFASLGKEDDPYTIDLNRAIELIEIKRKIERERVIKIFKEREDVQVLKATWATYLLVDGENYRLPKDTVAEKLTLAACLDIAANTKPSPGKKKFAKKGAAKTAVKKTAAKKAPAKQAAAAKPSPKKAAKKKVEPKEIVVSKAPVKKSTVKKGSATKATLKKSPVKKSPVKKVAPSKTASKKSPAKKSCCEKDGEVIRQKKRLLRKPQRKKLLRKSQLRKRDNRK
ncbi:MAG: type I DNA topoisomerase [Bacteroidetes bacterium]|nr:type I DNA topoisomerase [Bacteroidota bacterium]